MTTLLVFFFFNGASASDVPEEVRFPNSMLMSRATRRMRRRNK